MKVTFVLGKDPSSERSGDTAIMRVLIDAVRALGHSVAVVSLGATVPKPRVSWRIALHAGLRRSLLHARFDVPELADAALATGADRYIAFHLYLAEALISRGAGDRTYAVHVVPEAPVWRHAHGLTGRLQRSAIERDERRVMASVASVVALDAADAPSWLPLAFPPREPVDVVAAPPRLLFLGDRRWAPNQAAFLHILALWSRIADGIDDAELVVAGRRPARRVPPLPSGVRDLGFVDDLDGLLRTCRGLVAPVHVGGGVRVKLLEAAAVGLPVVATSVAAGSLADLLDIKTTDADEEFIAACRTLLLDAAAAAAEGSRLYAAGAAAASEVPTAVAEWLR